MCRREHGQRGSVARTKHHDRRYYACWAVIDPGSENAWTAKCLDYGTVARAADPETALMMLVDATGDAVLHDLGAGREPLDHRSDDEAWEILEHMFAKPQLFMSFEDAMASLPARGLRPTQLTIAAQFFLSYQRVGSSRASVKTMRILRPIWIRERIERGRVATRTKIARITRPA